MHLWEKKSLPQIRVGRGLIEAHTRGIQLKILNCCISTNSSQVSRAQTLLTQLDYMAQC